MNPLRQNLSHALLSLALLATIASIGLPDRQIEAHRQILRMTTLVASAVCNFDGIACIRNKAHRINPGVALKQVVRELRQRDDY